jgi:predicted ThiF/HesA family dinucleotide-utilizing enzyme
MTELESPGELDLIPDGQARVQKNLIELHRGRWGAVATIAENPVPIKDLIYSQSCQKKGVYILF